MAARPAVLLLGEVEHAQEALASLSTIADIIRPKSRDRASFIAECSSSSSDLSRCVAAYRTGGSISVTGRIDSELVSHLPPSLKFISHCGAGYDQVDVSACTERGIRVSNVPKAVDDATADTNMFLILGALRNFNQGMTNLRAGRWLKDADNRQVPSLGHDPQGKVLGILGMGGIGRNLARKAKVFGMEVIYYNRTRLGEEVEREEAGGARYVGFEELLSGSDVLSLNLPLNKNTRHIISGREFGKMKKGVVVVNTARGAVMDEGALVEALESGKVASCGLDVFEEEPKVHEGLLGNPRVMLIPHMGTYSVETSRKMEEWTLANVREAVERGGLLSIVPEQRDMA